MPNIIINIKSFMKKYSKINGMHYRHQHAKGGRLKSLRKMANS